MIVLGIDPGYALMGWGVVEAEGSRMKLINYGCIETKAGVPMQNRLRTLQLGVRDLLNIYKPDDVAFEELFFARNVTTALMVGAARGAEIIAAAEYTNNLYEYTPMQIKQASEERLLILVRRIRFRERLDVLDDLVQSRHARQHDRHLRDGLQPAEDRKSVV